MKVKQLIFAAFACTVLVAGCSVDTTIVEKDYFQEESIESNQLIEITNKFMANRFNTIQGTTFLSSLKTSYLRSFIEEIAKIQNLLTDPPFFLRLKSNSKILPSKFNYSPAQSILIKPSFLLVKTHQRKSELIFTTDFHDSYMVAVNRKKRLT